MQPCPDSIFDWWHRFFQGLRHNRVVIPFAEQLAGAMPADRIQSRRDLPKLLGLIECSAYLNQDERPQRPEGIIVAQPDDYYAARVLFAACCVTALEKSAEEFLRTLRDEKEGFLFSVEEMMQRAGWQKTKTYDVLARLGEIGCVTQQQRGTYKLVRRQPEPVVTLPPKLRLTLDNFRISVKIPLQAPTSEMTTPGGCLGGKAENGAATSVETGREGQQEQQVTVYEVFEHLLQGQQLPSVADEKSGFSAVNTRLVADVAPPSPQDGKWVSGGPTPYCDHGSDCWSPRDDGTWRCQMCDPL